MKTTELISALRSQCNALRITGNAESRQHETANAAADRLEAIVKAWEHFSMIVPRDWDGQSPIGQAEADLRNSITGDAP